MNAPVPAWIEAVTALFVVAGGVVALIAAAGLLRYRAFFQRFHPPALAATLSAACLTLASIVYFSALEHELVLYPLLINVLLAITTPVTTMLLARAGLARQRTPAPDATPSAPTDDRLSS